MIESEHITSISEGTEESRTTRTELPSRAPRITPAKIDQPKHVPIEILHHEKSTQTVESISPHKRTAIHSGKLGDVIYALPACRDMGITHLVLNVYLPLDEPLRHFPYTAAKQILPLLLAQDYLEEVTISKCQVPLENLGHEVPGIDYNFDTYRKVPRHRAGKKIQNISPKFCRFPKDDPPAHLGETFGATLGLAPDLEDPWLKVEAALETKEAVVISLTKNWRTYSDHYWKTLTAGLPKIIFVGHKSEWELANIKGSEFIESEDHLRLASLIAGSKLFLGTVSFPYSVAEGLKVKRGVEICHRQMNAFPLGKNGFVLPPDVLLARDRVANLLGLDAKHPYRRKTHWLRINPSLFVRRLQNIFATATLRTDRTRTRVCLDALRELRNSFMALCNF